jgi:hypothetical protein
LVKIAIIGGGHGGTAILKTLHALGEIEVVGITDINESAPGILLARELGIFNTNSIEELLALPADLIIEVTGNANVQKLITNYNVHNATIIYSDAAELMMILVNHQQGLTHRLENQMAEIRNISDITKKSVDKMREAIDNTQKLSKDLYDFSEATMKHVKETDQIIKLIDRITQQTNILGLNASIEAARAGESKAKVLPSWPRKSKIWPITAKILPKKLVRFWAGLKKKYLRSPAIFKSSTI